MGCYRVTFLKTLTNSYGTPFLTCQRAIDVPYAESRTDAVEVAKRYFERIEKIPEWQLHADAIEVELLPRATAAPRHMG